MGLEFCPRGKRCTAASDANWGVALKTSELLLKGVSGCLGDLDEKRPGEASAVETASKQEAQSLYEASVAEFTVRICRVVRSRPAVRT